jgi:hypothetical protein
MKEIYIKHTLMLSPLSITRSLIVYSREELELVQGYLLRLNSQLMLEFPLRSPLHAHNSGIQLRASLSSDSEGMRAASICPHIRECYLLGGALLKEQALVGIEEENGEGTVKKAPVNVGHEMAY